MEDKTLLRLALGTAVTGLLVLYFASANSGTRALELSEVSEDELGRLVEVSGTISRIKLYEKSTLLFISDDESELQVYAPFRFEGLGKGNYISVRGEVKEYKGTLEVVPFKEEDLVVLDGSGKG